MIIANVTPIKINNQSYSGSYTSGTPGMGMSSHFWYDPNLYDQYFHNYFKGTKYGEGGWEPKEETDSTRTEIKLRVKDRYDKYNLEPGDMKIVGLKGRDEEKGFIRAIDLQKPYEKRMKTKMTPPSKFFFDFCKGLGD